MFFSLAALTLVFPIIINNYVTPGIDWMVVLSSYIGMILVCAALLALGTGISAIFTNQFAAFFVTLGLFFFLWFMVSLPAKLFAARRRCAQLSESFHTFLPIHE